MFIEVCDALLLIRKLPNFHIELSILVNFVLLFIIVYSAYKFYVNLMDDGINFFQELSNVTLYPCCKIIVYLLTH